MAAIRQGDDRNVVMRANLDRARKLFLQNTRGYVVCRTDLYPVKTGGKAKSSLDWTNSVRSYRIPVSPDGHRHRHELTCATSKWFRANRKRIQPMGDELISVQLDWSDWHTAMVPLSDLRDVHWHQPSRAPHALLHGYVACSGIVSGNIPYDCQSQSAPHRLRVCILRKHVLAGVYSELSRRANERCARATVHSLSMFRGDRHA